MKATGATVLHFCVDYIVCSSSLVRLPSFLHPAPFFPHPYPHFVLVPPLRCLRIRYAVALDLEEEAGNVLRTGDTVRAVP